jgi:hypothetical protein
MKATIFNPNSIREGYIAWDPNAKDFKYRDGNKIRIFDDTTANAEPDLGLPRTDGDVLSSSITGVRTWISPSTGGGTAGVTSFKTRTGVVVPASGDYDIPKIIGLQPALDAKAPIASPTFTGVARAETAGAGTNTTQIATTAFVKRDFVDIGGDTMTGNLLINTSGGNNFSLTSPVGKSIAMGISGSPPEFSIVGSSITPYTITSYDSSGTIQSALAFKTNGNLGLTNPSGAVTPLADEDLANKKYVDDHSGGITEQPAIPDLPDLTSTPTDAEFDDIINKINTTLATLRTAGIIAT